MMKLNTDWHDFRAKLDKLLYPRVGEPTQLSLKFADDPLRTVEKLCDGEVAK